MLFTAGWAAGRRSSSLSFAPGAGRHGEEGDTTNVALGVIRIILGLLFVGFAYRQWQNRPRPGHDPDLPAWMKTLDTFTGIRALGLGAVLAAANPKNLPLLISAAGSIGQAELDTGEVIITVIVFVVLASLGMLIPLVVYAAAGDRGPAILDSARTWLVTNNGVIMAVLFLILGVNLVGKGIGSF